MPKLASFVSRLSKRGSVPALVFVGAVCAVAASLAALGCGGALWFSAALRAPDVNAKLVGQGFSPVGLCGEPFRALLRKQYEQYSRVIREAKIGE